VRIIGVDPGTATTGFGIIDVDAHGNYKMVDGGVITTSPDDPMPQRLRQLYDDLTEVIAATKPEAAAVELLYFSKNVTTGISVGQARGVILLALAKADLTPGEYNPMQVKMAVTGYGAAKKPQVQEMVRVLLGLKVVPHPDDAADALAVAIAHAHSFKNVS
jgi:crossover junction endodeoxyribonuclease RuvC